MPAKNTSRRSASARKPAKKNFSFVLGHPQNEKMATFLGFVVANGVKCQMGTIMRALIDAGSKDMEFLAIVRRLAEVEHNQWLERRGLKAASGPAVNGKPAKMNFSFIPTESQSAKMHDLLNYAGENGVKCQMSTIMRALIEAGSDDVEFLGIVRCLAEEEKEQWLAKRSHKNNLHENA